MSIALATKGVIGQRKVVVDVQPSTTVSTKDKQVNVSTIDTSRVKIKVGC